MCHKAMLHHNKHFWVMLTYTTCSFTCLESFLLDVAEVLPVRDDGLPEPGLRGLSDLGGILGNVGVLWLLANPFVAGLAFILVLIELPAPFLTPLVFRPADRWSPLVIRRCHGIQTVWVQSKPLDSAGWWMPKNVINLWQKNFQLLFNINHY